MRTFVDIKRMLGFSNACLSATLHAEELDIEVQSLKKLNLDSSSIKMIEERYQESVKIYKVNGSTFVVPTFGNGRGLGMTHVRSRM